MAFLLPPKVRKHALDATNEGTFDLDASEDGGHQLAAWWLSQDPLPATRKNERVIEHLRRAALARTQYPRERCSQ
jgi:hypothetical protein